MDEPFEYLQRRVEPQRKWHNEKARWNKQRYYCVEIATLVAGAAIPIVNLWAADDPYWGRLLSAIFGGLIVLAVAVGKLFKFQENWLQFRTLVEALEREVALYKWGATEYAEAEQSTRHRLFVERVENILASSTAQFIAAHRTARETTPETP